MRQYKYKKNTFVSTSALSKWRDAQGLTWSQVSEKAGESQIALERWATRKSVPRAILDKLGIKCRASRNRADTADKKLASGTFSLYIVSVTREQDENFKTLSKALGVEIKHAL